MNNPTCLKCEYAPAYFSVAQRFAADFIYQLPVSQWQALSGLPRRLTQGWKIAGVFQAQTGFPFSIDTQYGSVQYGYDNFNGVGAYPNLLQMPTPGPKTLGVPQFFSDTVIGSNDGQGTGYFDQPLALSPVAGVGEALVSPGNLGRNRFTSPAWSNLDFSLIKETKFTESKTLQFRAEFFNILNQAPFGVPNGTLGATGFGLFGGTATTQRRIQFALRLIF